MRISRTYWGLNLAALVPRKLVYWCLVRVFGEVTTSGKHRTTIAGDLTFIDAVKAWDEKEPSPLLSIKGIA